MPIDAYIDEARRCVVATVRGDFTLDEILLAINRAVHDPRYHPGFAVLSDHTGVGKPLTTPQAKGMVEHFKHLRKFMAGTRWAVVGSKPASTGMLNMLSVLAERGDPAGV